MTALALRSGVPTQSFVKATLFVQSLIAEILLDAIFEQNDNGAFSKFHGASPETFCIDGVLPLGRGEVVLQGEEPSYYLANVGLGGVAKDSVIASGTCFLVRALSNGEVVDGKSISYMDEKPCPFKEGGKAWKRWQQEREEIGGKVRTTLHIVCMGERGGVFNSGDDNRSMGRVGFRNETGLIEGVDLRAKLLNAQGSVNA